ncbi:MAG: DUF952 domain-containing protein [Ilumatobacteraceae bacterium]
MVLHLLPADDWSRSAAAGLLEPASLATEGFVHCCADDDQLLAVANRFYRDLQGPVLAVTLDESRFEAPVRWEAPAHPDGTPAAANEPRFPHVYGAIPTAAAIVVRELTRDPDGSYAGFTPGSGASAVRTPPG